MLKKLFILFIFVLLAVSAFSCVDIENRGVYVSDVEVCNDIYFLDNGIIIHGENFIFDCKSAVLRGVFENSGITVMNSVNITIKNCNILLYDIALNIQNSEGIILQSNHLIKNNYGIKFFASENNFVYSADVSLKSPLKIAGSSGNFIHYFNKKIKENLNKDNKLNRPLSVSKESSMFDLSSNIIVWLNYYFK